jgi:putative molybdopterin biosynthesis protein
MKAPTPMPELMTTKEAAAYLRLKERKIYDLVRSRRIPCTRVTGKLLFPKQVIDLWISRHTVFEGLELRPAPPVAGGSHDPLLEWALRESGCDLASLSGGSEDGVRRLAAGKAMLAGLHMLDPETGAYNVHALGDLSRLADVVLIHWAMREQGLVVATGGRRGVNGIADLRRRGVRVAQRQTGAGAQILLRHLLAREGLRLEDLTLVEPPMLTETDIATAVLDGKADCGLAIRAVAQRFRLDFVSLHKERFDLAMRRRDYFDPAIQKLLRFAQAAAFREKAEELGGYDIAEIGTVVFNA